MLVLRNNIFTLEILMECSGFGMPWACRIVMFALQNATFTGGYLTRVHNFPLVKMAAAGASIRSAFQRYASHPFIVKPENSDVDVYKVCTSRVQVL